MKKILLYICSISMLVNILFAQDETSSAPQVSSYALNPDNMGAIGNSVNLFTGDVNLPLNLVSMQGRNGLGINVGIFYNSNVQKVVGTWNLEAPTGVVGLGWSMPVSQIIVDHKNTGARDDDDFYLVDGGSNNRLIRTGGDNTAKTYTLKNYRFWKITYYPASEKWEIIKEDGLKYIYGDNTSDRNTVQYLVKWGNWIGNSALTTGQSNQANVWDISEVVNSYDEKIKYTYEIVEETVEQTLNSGGLKYTKASYIKNITDQFNRQIDFTYADKGTEEYQDPHVEKVEPDAYQERLETKYLSTIEVKNENSVKLFSIEFKYDGTYGTGNLKKRLLTEIIQKNKNDNSLPSLKFAYIASGNNMGALQTITYPSGGSVTYNYQYEELNIDRSCTITRPDGFTLRDASAQENYTVVSWVKYVSASSSWILRYDVYEWKGGWTKTITKDLIIDPAKLAYIQISYQKDFFAVLLKRDQDSPEALIGVFSKDERNNNWNYEEFSFAKPVEQANTAYLYAGKDYIKVLLSLENEGTAFPDTELKGLIRKNDAWINDEDIKVGNYNATAYMRMITGCNNSILMHQLGKNILNIHYIDEMGAWHKSNDLGIGGGTNTRWFMTSVYALGMIHGGNENIIWWDENYNLNSSMTSTLGAYPDEIPINYLDYCMVGIFDKANRKTDVYRFDGATWRYLSALNNITDNKFTTDRFFGFGPDYVIKRWGGKNFAYREWNSYNFNPNTLTWVESSFTHNFTSPKIEAGYNFYLLGYDLYFKNSGGVWENKFTLPDPDGENGTYISNDNVNIGSNYLNYQYSDGGNITKVVIMKNGTVLSGCPLDAGYNPLGGGPTGLNSFITFNASLWKDVTEIVLYHVINDNHESKLIDYPVNQIKIFDGKINRFISYDYLTNNAKIDPSGQFAYYNKIKTIQGSSSSGSVPFGYTETYFFNGSDTKSLAEFIPDKRTNADTYYGLLTGTPYQVIVKNSSDQTISTTQDFWYVNTIMANKENAYYPTKAKTIMCSEEIYDSTIYIYNADNGMEQKTIHRCDVQTDAGKRDFISEVKYAFELSQYSAMKTKNMLAQVYETKTFEAENGVAKEAFISGARSDYDVATGMPISSQTWDGLSWITTSQITGRDAVGNVTEVYNPLDGAYSSTVWGYDSKLPIASVPNARSSEVKIENCEFFSDSEALVLGMKKIGIINIAKSSNVFSGQGQYFSGDAGTGIEYTIGMIPAQKSYIIEFDYYIEAGQLNIKLGTTAAGETSLGSLNTTGTLKHARYTAALTANIAYALRFLSAGTGGKFIIDNIRVYPADAYCVSTIYDKNTNQKLAGTDANGITSTVEYDEYDAPVRQRNWKNQIVSEQNSYLSKSWNATYNSDDPNYSISASFPNGNYVRNWSFEEDQASKIPVNWNSAGQPTSIVTDGKFGRRAVKIVRDVTNNSSLMQNLGKFESGKTLTASAWFKAEEGIQGQIYLGDYNDATNGIIVSMMGNGGWQRISVTLTLNKPASISVFIYGHRVEGSINGQYVIYDDVMVEEGSVPSDPIVNIAYTNGIGQTIQTQSIENTQRHIIATEYDAIGRDYKTWRAYKADGSTGYDANYATACSTYYGSAKQYTQKEYYADPLSRIYRIIPIEPTDDNEAPKTYYDKDAANSLKCIKTEGKLGPLEDLVASYKYYDKLGRQVKSVIGDRIAYTTYNKQGKAVQTIDPMGYISTMTYDYQARLKSKTTPDAGISALSISGTTEYIYDKAGRLRAMLEPEGRRTSMYKILYLKYDKLSRVIEKGYTQYPSTNWSNGVQNEINTSSNWPAAPTAWRKKYTYGDALASNAYGRLLKIQVNSDTDADAELEETFAYDENGQTISKTMKSVSYDSKIYVTNYAYDALGRTTKIYYPTSETVNPADISVDNQTFASGTSSYNSYGMISSANTTINSGASLTFTAGRTIRLKPGFKASSGSSFKAKIADPVMYTYDQRGNTKYIGVADDIDYYASYEYNSDGSMKTESLNNKQNPILTNYTYDSKGRLTRMGGSNFSETIGYSTGDYTQKSFYSLIGTSMCSYTIGASAMISQYEYDYDNYGRLVSAYVSQNSPKNIGVGSGKATTYDKNDKITSLTKNTTTYPYNYYSGSNKLQNTDGSGDDYGYDYNGNLTAAAPRNLTTTYDIFNQMPMSQTVGSNALNFEYDANNERTYMLSGNVKQLYLRGLGEYPLVTLENTSGVEKATQYIYGPTGLIYVKNSSENLYLNKDHLGSVRVVQYEGSSEIAAYYDYNPYGEITLQGGGSVSSPYKFAGQEFDDETGLFNFRARLYDPAIGMFYGVDPAGQTYSPYGYAGNNPVIFVDRDGRLFGIDDAILLTIAYGALQGAASSKANHESFLQGLGKGALVATASAGLSHIIGQANGLWQTVGKGSLLGGFSGGLDAGLHRGDIAQSAVIGIGIGGVMSAIGYAGSPALGQQEQVSRPAPGGGEPEKAIKPRVKTPKYLAYAGVSGTAALKWLGLNFEFGVVTDGNVAQLFLRFGYATSNSASLNIGIEGGATTVPTSFEEFRGQTWSRDPYVNPVEVEAGTTVDGISYGINTAHNPTAEGHFKKIIPISIGSNIGIGFGNSVNFSNFNISSPSVPFDVKKTFISPFPHMFQLGF